LFYVWYITRDENDEKGDGGVFLLLVKEFIGMVVGTNARNLPKRASRRINRSRAAKNEVEKT